MIAFHRLARTAQNPVFALLPVVEWRSARRDQLSVVRRLAGLIRHGNYPGIIALEDRRMTFVDFLLMRVGHGAET
jgi:hypothetical protein